MLFQSQQAPTQADEIRPKMFDHFFIFGGSIEEKSIISPTLLCAYPSTGNQVNSEELSQITKFSFPNGFSTLTDIIYLRKNIILEKFVFFMKKSGQRIYGACVHFFVPEGKCPFFSNNLNRKYPFCLCFISHLPCISVHIRFATNLALVLLGISQPHENSPKIPANSCVRGLCYPSLTLDKKHMSIAVKKGMNAPEILLKELLYYEQKDALNLSTTQHLLYPTIHTLFSFLKIQDIIKLYAAILLERKVLFVSRSISKYSTAVIAMTALGDPFNVFSIILPVVPPDFSMLLESPFPYIAGSLKSCDNADVIADLDEGFVLDKSGIPDLPSQNILTNKLYSLLQYEKESTIIPQQKIKLLFSRKEYDNPQYAKLLKSLSDESFPICKISLLSLALRSEITEMIKITIDGHLIPQLSKIVNSISEKNTEINVAIANNAKMCDKYFFNEFISTQGGSSIFIPHKTEISDVLKLFI